MGINDLCGTCSKIRLGSVLEAVPEAFRPRTGGCGVPNFYEFSIQQPLLFPDVDGTKASCALCALIALQAKGSVSGPLELAGLIPPNRHSHPNLDYTSMKDENGRIKDMVGSSEPQWQGLISGEKMVNTMEPVTTRRGSRIKEEKYQIHSPWQISLAADAGTAASKYVTRRPLAEKGSAESFSKLLDIINNCTTKHARCKLGVDGREMPMEVDLPTRVIDVGSEDPPQNPRLVISKGCRGQYASLSHCWGNQRWVATTKARLPDMLDGFVLDNIPKTYADAILVTRKLGLPYLWIDSFCIIQDDRDDWHRESLIMGDIYERAWCNIAATGAEDGRAGFLAPRRAKPRYVRVPSTDGSDYVYFCNQANSDFNKYVRYARINTRGWVLQERILSRRTIHFAEDQWYWECSENIVSEDGWQHQTQLRQSYNSISLRGSIEESTMQIGKIFKHHDKTIEGHGPPKTLHKESAEVLWAQILRSYSRCQLTFATDKMPALQGLANKFGNVVHTQYYFGHWLQTGQNLPSSLMWYAAEEGGLDIPSELRAPSWSCLKADGPLGFHDCRDAISYTTIEELHQDTGSSLSNESSIVLRGLVRNAKRAFPNGSGTAKKDTFYSLSFTSKTAYGTFTNTLGPAKFDIAQDVPEDVSLLLTFSAARAYFADQLALILHQVGDDDQGIPTYRRIGIANVNNGNFFREESSRLLKII